MVSATEVAARKEINSVLLEGKLPCAGAFGTSKKLSLAPLQVGTIASAMNIRISRCQLGLFGYGPKSEGKHRIVVPAPEVSSEMRAAIEASLVNGRLSCKNAWVIAKKLSCSRLSVSAAAETLNIRIGECQLGCF